MVNDSRLESSAEAILDKHRKAQNMIESEHM